MGLPGDQGREVPSCAGGTAPLALFLGIVAALALLALPAAASAKTVAYTGQGTHLKAGQTKGLPVLMGFELVGKGCPRGDRCFKHAKVQNFDGVSYAFPNCPELL